MPKTNQKDVHDPETGKRRCTATSKHTGARCRRAPIPGGHVCVKHGGGAPQVQEKAKERLAALVEPSIDRLAALMRQSKHLPTARQAASDLLDRAGVKAPTKIDPTDGGGLVIRWQVEGE